MRRIAKHRRREEVNAKAYALVEKLMQAGCRKKSAAVREAAADLCRSERDVWTSLREHERELRWRAEEDRQLRITLGEEKPTDEEIEKAGDQWIQYLIDLRRGK